MPFVSCDCHFLQDHKDDIRGRNYRHSSSCFATHDRVLSRFNHMEILLFILYPLALYRPRLILAALALQRVHRSNGRELRTDTAHRHAGHARFSRLCDRCRVRRRWLERKRDLFSYLTIPLILLFLAGSLVSPSMPGPLPPVLKPSGSSST